MPRPHILCAALCCALSSSAQQSDTIFIHYKPDQFRIIKAEQVKLDSFLIKKWDRIFITGFTDETEGEEYNLELSRRRSAEVFDYLKKKNIPETALATKYLGEAMPRADNGTDEGKAINRRTEIIGIRLPGIAVRPKVPEVDLMIPVTRTLDNGIIITYRPGLLPDYMSDVFESGSGMNLKMIGNTLEMRRNNLFNNTTRGEILSSVMILCGSSMNPCKLDSPILVKVPVPFQSKCPITSVKFFNAVVENGRRIWAEQTKMITPEVINGIQYVGVWMDDFCECINFDFKIDPECYDTDSTRVFYTKGTIRNMNAELLGFNSVYLPKQIDDSTQSIMFIKNQLDKAPLSFALYQGKKRIRGFKDKILSSFPYDEEKKQYILSTGTQKLHFPGLDIWGVTLKVNGDKYVVAGEKNKYDYTYLKYKQDSIVVDFFVMESRNRMTQFRNISVESLPYNSEKGARIIDKKVIRELKQRTSIAAH